MTSVPIQVREAEPADQAEIRAMTLAAYTEYASQIPAHWEGYRQNILATLARPEPAEQIVAEQAGQIVGSVLLYPTESGADGRPWPEVRLLAVHPTARGQGIGAVLMAECIRRAGHAGADALTLHTSPLMRAAVRLYERLGFERAPELDFQPAPDLWISGYRLTLDPGNL
jgi:predicted N-acetyltransferase YhbS